MRKKDQELTYEEQLKDERWLTLREEVIERDFRICQKCMSGKKLHVHHRYYLEGRLAWEYPISALITYCESCHKEEHERVGRVPNDPLLKLFHELHSLLPNNG